MQGREPDIPAGRPARDRRLRLAVGSSLLVRPLAALVPAVVVPVFFRYLGAERYGLFEIVSSFASWVGLTGFGVGFGLNNRLMDCYVGGDRERARAYVSTAFFPMLGVLLAGCLTLAGAIAVVDWRSLFNVSGGIEGSELRWAVAAAVLPPLVGVCVNFAPAVLAAYQEIHHQVAWEAVARIATLAACLSLPLTALGVPGAVLALGGVPVLVGLVSQLWLWGSSKPWLRPDPGLVDKALLGGILRDGLALFALQSAVALMFQADRLVLGTLRTPVEVAGYGVVARCFMLAYGLFVLSLGPLWPAYGEAFRRGDLAWCDRKLRLSTRLGLGVVAAAGLVMGAFGDTVLRALAGREMPLPPRSLVLGFTVACALRSWADSHSVFLNGANVLAPQVVLLGANAGLALLFAIAGTLWLGAVGTAWAYPLAALFTTAWGYPWLVRRHRRRFGREG
jgi:O-antigen/teichoic acid export membrane protein